METISIKKTNHKGHNLIGLNIKKSKEVSDKLNELLASYSFFYQNLRGYHWNIKGEKFFELHLKFEELYTDIQVKIDEVAERILTLGNSPEHNFSNYKKNTWIAETNQVSNGIKAAEDILHSFHVLIDQQRDIMNLSAEAGDEGTKALLNDYIKGQEKLIWMYSAFLGR